MSPAKTRLIQTTLWLLPTWIELFVYVAVVGATLFVSNSVSLARWLFVPQNFSLIGSITGSIDELLQRLVGERIAASLSLAIFWGLVGMLVYVIIWLISNFSTELNNDLILSKYVHPRAANLESPIKQFFSKFLFRTAIVFVMIFYINLMVRVFLPLITAEFNIVLTEWPKHKSIRTLIICLLAELILLHGFVVLTRLLTLRKRVFSS